MIRIEPVPTPEEAAAIAVVIARLTGKAEILAETPSRPTSRWPFGLQQAAASLVTWGSWWR